MRVVNSLVSLGFLIVVAHVAMSKLAHAQGVEARYDATFGTLSLAADTPLVLLRIESQSGLIKVGQVPGEEFARDFASGVINNQAPYSIQWANLQGFTPGGLPLGMLLPTGLSEAEIQEDLSLIYRARFEPMTDREGAVFVVPEPSSLMLSIVLPCNLILFCPRRSR